jgi:hypothetical protein
VAGSSSLAEPSDPIPRPWLFDRQGWSTLLAGVLLLLISFITNYGDDNLLHFANLQAHEQVGVGLHLAALAALAGDVELASRLRHRAAQARQRAACRAQLQDGCLVAQGRVLLSASPFNRLQLSEAMALLIEEMRRRG